VSLPLKSIFNLLWCPTPSFADIKVKWSVELKLPKESKAAILLLLYVDRPSFPAHQLCIWPINARGLRIVIKKTKSIIVVEIKLEETWRIVALTSRWHKLLVFHEWLLSKESICGKIKALPKYYTGFQVK
jgi:hypothetical protein